MQMSVKSDIKTHVGSWTGLTALIGNRLYPITLPQTPTLPSVTYLVISGTRIHMHDGDAGLGFFRVQFDSYAVTPEETELIIDQIVSAMIGWYPIDHNYAAFPQTPQDLPEPELSRFRMTLDVMITHKE